MAGSGTKVVKKGEFLVVQGEKPRDMVFLEDGTLEILAAPGEFQGLDKKIIGDKSVHVGTLQGKVLLGGFSKNFQEPYRKSVRALADSKVSRFSINGHGFKGLAASDPVQAASILKQLYNRFINAAKQYEKSIMLNKNISRISDNISIIYSALSQSNASPVLHEQAEALTQAFKDSGGQMPSTFSARFLVQDTSSFSDKEFSTPAEVMDNWIHKDASELIKNMLMLDQKQLATCIKQNPAIAVSVDSLLTDAYNGLLDEVATSNREVKTECTALFGNEHSWVSYLVDGGGMAEWEESRRLEQGFLKSFVTLIAKLNSVYEELLRRKIIDDFSGIRKFQTYMAQAGSRKSVTETASESSVSSGEAAGVLKRSLHQIFDFSFMDKDFQTKFIKLLNEFKNSKNPFNTESDGRKLRRSISIMYWDMYKQAYIRSKKESTVPLPVKLMLTFGFIDETLMEPGQLTELIEISRGREKMADIPVVKETDFLNWIYEGKESPSITEMGLTYEGFLREQDKRNRRGTTEVDASEVLVNKALFEIDQRLKSTAAVCSGSTATAFPILTSMMVKGTLKNMYSSKEKITSIIHELMDSDFSVFYRETVLKLGDAREIIQEEVLPYIIVLPIFGTKTLLWQELAGTNKRSRARFVVPAFFLGDLKKSIAHSLACFRWEISRTIKGALWADPVEGGVTGEYFDYVNTYKKNTKLSSEAKEKIGERFKSLRTNRDRFADDYLTWVFFEKNGIMKLNAVVRAMYFKYLPFRADVRERLEKMPAFSHVANRYKNVNKKNIEQYERRFKKYQDGSGNYPIEIAKYFEFLGT